MSWCLQNMAPAGCILAAAPRTPLAIGPCRRALRTCPTCTRSPAASTWTSSPPRPAFTMPYHNVRTEGLNTRTKMIKRQMYGRAGFELLCHPHPPQLRSRTVTTESATEPSFLQSRRAVTKHRG